MRTTILMAGLIAGLAGGAMAQEAATPEAGTAQPGTQAAPAAPDRGAVDEVPNMAPLALSIHDENDDGRITPEEIEAAKAARFAQADADGNGGLSSEELFTLQEAIRAEVQAARAAGAIARFDDNGDGLLQADEIEARTPRHASVFDRLDTDSDGAITQAELDAMRERRGDGEGRGRGGRGDGSRGEGPGGWGWGVLPGLLDD